MARPIKFGLDYFPLDVSMDDKFELIEARHDILGFAVIIKLLQKIYSNGYFINVNEDSIIVFSKRINVDINKVNAIINDSLRYEIFDETKYKKYNILTSHGIQMRFIEATSRRKNVELIKEYLVNVDINSLNEHIYIVNDYKSTQSKGKEIKGEVKKYKYSEFYDSEIEKSNENADYIKFVKFLFGGNDTDKQLKRVLSLRDQLTYLQFEKILTKSIEKNKKLKDMLLDLENVKKYTEGRVSMYSTFNSWLNR